MKPRKQSVLARSFRRGPASKTLEAIKTPHQLRCAIARLSPDSPATDRFTDLWRRRSKKVQQESSSVWYCTQHEHWLGWLRDFDGPGAYGRKDWHRSAEFVYNHIVNPQMLVYLAEACGISKRLLSRAIHSALDGSSMPAMSAAIRSTISWDMIQCALLRREERGRRSRK